MTDDYTLTEAERKALDERVAIDMWGYYLHFEPTGCPEVDRVLSAIGLASKAYHHTEHWNDDLEFDYGPIGKGTACADFIQRAAHDAAARIAAAEQRGREEVLAERDALRDERDRLKRGGAELGKSLVAWMELAKDATGSADLIDEDGDGDWGAVAERMAEIPGRLAAIPTAAAHKRQVRRAEAAEAALAGLLAEVEGLASQANDEAQTHWYHHSEAADDGDLDRANREGEVAEVFDQTRSALRAIVARLHDGGDS